MKETVEQAAKEQAAKEYADGLRSVDQKNTYDDIEVDSSRMVAFKRGAEWQSNQSPWISIEERMPEHDNGQSLCEVIIKFDDGSHYIVANIDVEDMVKVGEATHWMPIPKV